MKKILSVLLIVNISACYNPININKNDNYKSFLNTQNYKLYKTNQINYQSKNIIYDIDGLTPYNKNIDSKTIKSDLKFKVDDYKDDDKNNGKDKEYKNFKIDKVKISENNKQVDNNGTESIIPDYSNSKKINLTIYGNFPEDFDKNKFFFRNDTNLLHLSYVGESNLKTVVLIDDSIVLNPISASNKYINVSIDTKNVPDFYLKGLHKIKVINENKSVSSMVRFGDPIKPNDSLTPQISKIELLKKEDDDEIKVIGLKLTGKNFMINPQFYYTKVDGVFCKGYQTDVVKTSGGDIFETIIDLSKQSNFLSKSNHVIEFYTPFGMIYSEFKV